MNRISVAVPVPTLDLLTYSVPDGMPAPAIGARVVVPIGSRSVTGIVVDGRDRMGQDVSGMDIKPVRQVLDAEAFVPPDIIALARWTAEYYAAGAGETITSVLPPKARGERADAHKTKRVATITAAGLEALATANAGSDSRALLRTLDPISRLRGRVFEYRGAKLIPTFHPAYLLRNPSSKREVWEDMKLVRSLLRA